MVENRPLECDHEIIVTSDLAIDFISGLDSMKRLGVAIDCPNNKLTCSLKSDNASKREGSSFTIQEITIPPRSSMIVDVRIDGRPSNDIILTPTTAEDEALVPHSINTANYGTTKTTVTNPANRPLKVKGGHNLASWSLANDTEDEHDNRAQLNMIKKVDDATEIEVGDHLNEQEQE